MLMPLLKFFRPKRKPRSPLLITQGKIYNLQEIYDRINARYFENSITLKITWVSPKRSKYRRRILLGSFHPHRNLIKVSRILDTTDTPLYFVEFIVYHEMLHFVHPPVVQRNRRKQIHHSLFREKEKLFQEYTEAQAFREESKSRWFIL